MIAEFYVVTNRSTVLLKKMYRDDLKDSGTWEIFSKKMHSICEGHIPPNFVEMNINFYYIRRGNIFFVATSMKELCTVQIIEFLSRLYHIMKDFCGVLTEESIRANCLLLNEILCDVMDGGYVQIISTEKLKPYITSEPVVVESNQIAQEDLATRLFGIDNRVAPVSAAQKPAVRTIMDENKKNEIFVDLVERVTAVTDSKGNVSRMEVHGTISVRNFLLGHPKIKIALNEDLQISATDQLAGFGSSAQLNRCNFHQCVDLTDFDSTRTFTFLPPPGEFSAMTYSVSSNALTVPMRILVFTSDVPNSKDVDVTLRVHCCVPANCKAAYVVVTLCVPSAVSSISQNIHGSSDSLKFNADKKQILWTIRKMPGGEESIARLRLITHGSQSISKQDIGPATVDFEISGHCMSGLHIRFLHILELDQTYAPHRWIRYVTVSDSFTVKTS